MGILALLTIFCFFSQQVLADLSVFCESTVFTGAARAGDFDEYEVCDKCSCFAFELLCLIRNQTDITIESKSYDFSTTCGNTCICNSVPEYWASTVNINKGTQLPDPVYVQLPPYKELEKAAKESNDTNSYENHLLEELRSGHRREQTVTVHPINDEEHGPLPKFVESEDVTSISQGCDDTLTCSLYYELDWSFALKAEVECAELDSPTYEPCFGTYACICTNGYFRISSNMPERPEPDTNSTSTGEPDELEALLEEASEAVAEEKEKEEAVQSLQQQEPISNNEVTEDEVDEGFEFKTWHYIVAGCGLVVILVLIGVSIFCCCKKCNKPDTGASVRPYPGVYEKEKKDGAIEVGQLGSLTEKKRMMKNNRSREGMPVPPTDDERSNLEIANPDSFLGNSQSNWKDNHNLKVHKDVHGNAMLSPNASAQAAKRNQFSVDDEETSNGHQRMQPSNLPPIQNQGKGQMKHTMSKFMENPVANVPDDKSSASRHIQFHK